LSLYLSDSPVLIIMSFYGKIRNDKEDPLLSKLFSSTWDLRFPQHSMECKTILLLQKSFLTEVVCQYFTTIEFKKPHALQVLE